MYRMNGITSVTRKKKRHLCYYFAYMQVAFVHDWFTMPGGADKVAHEIIDVIRPSEIFCLFNFMDEDALKKVTPVLQPNTSFIQRLPFARRIYRHLAPLYPIAISRLDVSDYDVIISSSWAAAKGIRKRPGQIHLCYCHTPMRFAWDLQDTYLEKYGYDSGVKRHLAKGLIRRLRNWDARTAQEVDFFMANSAFVADRIVRAYGRRSEVIYPPVDTRRFTLHERKSKYYFTASRFVDYKNLDLIVRAFNSMPDRQLLIAGQGPLEKNLRKMAGPNIRFLGWVNDEELVQFMQRARAFVNASIEDFGIAGLEAQACGTPVIALGLGGYSETVIEGVTGLFFHREHHEALADAIIRFEKKDFDPFVIRKHAINFDRDIFRESFVNFFLDKTFSHVRELA